MSGGYERISTVDDGQPSPVHSASALKTAATAEQPEPIHTAPSNSVTAAPGTGSGNSSSSNSNSSGSGSGSDSGSGSGAGIEESRKLPLTLIPVGGSNRAFVADSEWSISKLKAEAFPQEVKSNKNIRFIFAGRLLIDSVTLKASGLTTNSFIHVSISDYKPASDEQKEAVSDIAIDASGAEAAQWGLDVQGFGVARVQAAQWEQARLQRDRDRDSNVGTNFDFFVGFIIGIAFGIIALLWLWMRNTPRKRKIGVICGMAAYFAAKAVVNDNSNTNTNANANNTNNTTGKPSAGGSTSGSDAASATPKPHHSSPVPRELRGASEASSNDPFAGGTGVIGRLSVATPRADTSLLATLPSSAPTVTPTATPAATVVAAAAATTPNTASPKPAASSGAAIKLKLKHSKFGTQQLDTTPDKNDITGVLARGP